MDATTSAFLREIITNLGPLGNLSNPFYLDPNFLGAILTSAVALFLGYMSIRMQRKHSQHIEKQLSIEQEPYVVAVDGISFDGYGSYGPRDNKKYLRLHLKNIGRGPAIRITVTGSKTDPDAPLMEDKHEPHSIDLGSGDEKLDWKIDEENLKKLVKSKYGVEITELKNNQSIYLYIFFNDQLKKSHKIELKLLRSASGDFLKVMENKPKTLDRVFGGGGFRELSN